MKRSEPQLPRRRARELALQALYAIELSGEPAGPAMEAVFAEEKATDEELDYARRLVEGTLAARAGQIDPLLERLSTSWPLRRMPAVDRNLLRLAAYELLHEAQVPRKVAINEAVEIAKRFCDPKSPAFVNAILDRVSREDSPESPDTASPQASAAAPRPGDEPPSS